MNKHIRYLLTGLIALITCIGVVVGLNYLQDHYGDITVKVGLWLIFIIASYYVGRWLYS